MSNAEDWRCKSQQARDRTAILAKGLTVMMGSRSPPPATTVALLEALTEAVAVVSSDELRQSLAELRAERVKLTDSQASLEATRAEHDARDAALTARAQALAGREDDLRARATALADERAAIDRGKAEIAAQTATLKQQRAELDRERAAFAGQASAFERAKSDLYDSWDHRIEMTTIAELERCEHDLVDVLFRLPMSDVALRTRAADTLQKVRKLKAEFLRRNPDIIRKGSTAAAAPPPRGSPLINDAEVRQMVREARDRTAAERRLSKGVVTYDPHRRDTDAAPLTAIRRALAAPYRESAGLIQLLTKRG